MTTHTPSGGGLRRLCMKVDLERYRRRNGPGQETAQAALDSALSAAAEAVGLDRSAWWRQECGDGELVVFPADTDEVALVSTFPRVLDDALRALRRRDGVVLRVRLAIHHGTARPAALGFGGDGIVEVSSIVDAQVVKDALAAVPEAHLVIALSNQFYIDIIRGGYTPWRSADFRKVDLVEDKFRGTAWLTMLDVDMGAVPLDEEQQSAAKPTAGVHQSASAGTRSTIQQAARDATYVARGGTAINVQRDLRIEGGHIGPHHGR